MSGENKYYESLSLHNPSINTLDPRFKKLQNTCITVKGTLDQITQMLTIFGKQKKDFTIVALYMEQMGDDIWTIFLTIAGNFKEFKETIDKIENISTEEENSKASYVMMERTGLNH